MNGPEIIVSIFLSLKNVVTSSSEGNTLVASFLLLTFNANDLQSSCLRNHKVKTVFQGQFQCCQRKFALNFHAKNDIKTTDANVNFLAQKFKCDCSNFALSKKNRQSLFMFWTSKVELTSI